VIYFGEPTAGQQQGWTESNSPLVGPKPMETIKVAAPGTRRFATLVPQVDPRWQITYGASSP
jgi:hypothetical protein